MTYLLIYVTLFMSQYHDFYVFDLFSKLPNYYDEVVMDIRIKKWNSTEFDSKILNFFSPEIDLI